MKLNTLRYSNPLSAILEDFFSIRFKPHQVVAPKMRLFWGILDKVLLKSNNFALSYYVLDALENSVTLTKEIL